MHFIIGEQLLYALSKFHRGLKIYKKSHKTKYDRNSAVDVSYIHEIFSVFSNYSAKGICHYASSSIK